MKLSDLGFDQWFEAHVGDSRQSDQDIARVTAVDRGAYLVRNESGEIPAELAGKFRFRAKSSVDLPCVGDWVTVQYHNSDTSAIIRGVLPRKTFLRRKCAGENADFQMIAANIDIAFIVQSCHFDFNLRRLDRYLAMATDGSVEPVILLTKTDLVSPDELELALDAVRRSGITARVLPISNMTGRGFDEFRHVLVPGITCCLIGSSGVGKTTLINRLIGHDAFDTKAVSGTGEGTHTTARRQLVVLEQGAMLIDTPGMRELSLLDASDGVDQSFDDISDLSPNCRYTNCSHTQEPGCAVLTAIANGELSEERHLSYLKLKKETEYHDLSYFEKRRKDRAFGRLVKSAKKQMKK
ncbi:MAG TPA: ribosome small subunit-dependent GTPase A [Lentisphaeria bacterium]|nr:MAG: ribosome small subunit-dependent GTPase A [Lentisphaerae bacterium GWF2_49_21]HBC88120.1 ribosome small subunit-dependent GTPase A [Lentisphaeria bacterium]